MKRKIRHAEKAIDALVQIQDDGYGNEAIANAIDSLNRLIGTLEPLVGASRAELARVA